MPGTWQAMSLTWEDENSDDLITFPVELSGSGYVGVLTKLGKSSLSVGDKIRFSGTIELLSVETEVQGGFDYASTPYQTLAEGLNTFVIEEIPYDLGSNLSLGVDAGEETVTAIFNVLSVDVWVETVAPPEYEAFILTNSGGKPKWSRYVFPFSLDGFAQLGDDLYIRSGDTIKRVSEQATSDIHNGVEIPFGGTAQWSWLDFGQPGTTKMLEAFDLVSSGDPSVSIGWDQTDTAAFTDPYQVTPDTVPGNIVPIMLSGASFSLKVDFAPGQKWELQGASLYVHDNKAAT